MNRSVTPANTNMTSPQLEMRMFVFSQHGYMRVNRDQTSQQQAVARHSRYLNGGYNHSSDFFKVLKPSTGAICYSRDMTWAHPRPSLVAPPPTAAGGGGGARPLLRRHSRNCQSVVCASVCRATVCRIALAAPPPPPVGSPP